VVRRFLPKHTIQRERTPRFLYLLSLLAFASWGGWGYLLLFVPPDKLGVQILFLLILFLALLFTLTFLFFEITSLFKKRGSRELFYLSARRAFFIALFTGFAGALKLLKIVSLPNLILFGLILLLTEIQLSRS